MCETLLNHLRIVDVVHANQFEQEVRHAAEVKEDDHTHSVDRFPSRPVPGQEKNRNRQNQDCKSETKFDIRCPRDHDQELDGEGEKKEKVELQESDINLYKPD